jgi:hypothetical protein
MDFDQFMNKLKQWGPKPPTGGQSLFKTMPMPKLEPGIKPPTHLNTDQQAFNGMHPESSEPGQPSTEMPKAAMYDNNDILKGIEAFFHGPPPTGTASPVPEALQTPAQQEDVAAQKPDHGQGDVKDPKHDGRLAENKQKEDPHDRVAEETLQATEEAGGTSDGGAKYEESDQVKSPYERGRVDHRAWIETPKTFDQFSAGNGLEADPSKMPNMKKKPMAPKLPAAPMGQEEKAIRAHPMFGDYANKALGPTANPEGLPALYASIKELKTRATTESDKNELQKFASQLAQAIIKQK